MFSSINYSRSTISADRGQKSFKLSFDQFMQKRGGQTIINRGKGMKKSNAALFAKIERQYGVPAGPLIAIWAWKPASVPPWQRAHAFGRCDAGFRLPPQRVLHRPVLCRS